MPPPPHLGGFLRRRSQKVRIASRRAPKKKNERCGTFFLRFFGVKRKIPKMGEIGFLFGFWLLVWFLGGLGLVFWGFLVWGFGFWGVFGFWFWFGFLGVLVFGLGLVFATNILKLLVCFLALVVSSLQTPKSRKTLTREKPATNWPSEGFEAAFFPNLQTFFQIKPKPPTNSSPPVGPGVRRSAKTQNKNFSAYVGDACKLGQRWPSPRRDSLRKAVSQLQLCVEPGQNAQNGRKTRFVVFFGLRKNGVWKIL